MKFRNLLFLAAAPVAAMLAGCPGGGGDDVAPDPSIALSSGSGYTIADGKVQIDSMVKFSIVANTADKEIQSFNVTASTNGGTPGTLKDSTVGKATFNYVYVWKAAGSIGDKVTLTFTAVDKNGKKKSTAVTMTLTGPNDKLGETSGQTIYNSSAPTGYKGGYDLNTGNNVAYADPAATKDILDLTAQGAATWAKSWGSGHGNTKYAAITFNDYNNTSGTNDLVDLWEAKKASATTTVSSTQMVNDAYFVVKTGQTGVAYDYYMIHVVTVAPAANKMDKVTFAYIHK